MLEITLNTLAISNVPQKSSIFTGLSLSLPGVLLLIVGFLGSVAEDPGANFLFLFLEKFRASD